MKKRKMIWMGLAVLSLVGFAKAGSSLKLGEQDGLAGECEVRGYDAEKGTVRLMMGGATTNLPFNSFSSDAQQKITAWATDEAFLSSSGLKISIKKQEEELKWKNDYTKSETNLVSYAITIRNSSLNEIKGVTVTHRIFWERQSTAQNPKRKGTYVTGERQIDLAPGQEVSFETEQVAIRDEVVVGGFEKGSRTVNTGAGGSFSVPDNSVTTFKVKDRLKGIHVQMSRPDRTGQVREKDAKNGSVPNERDWPEYSLFQDRRAAKEERLAAKKDKAPVVWDDARIEQYTRRAEGGSLKDAYVLYRHYRDINDSEKRQYWAGKCRELAEQNPDDRMSSKILAMLRKLE